MFDIAQVRHEFPALKRRLSGRPVIFADSAATSLKPMCVIKAVEHYYTHICANVHRGINVLAQEADELYEDARRAIAQLVNGRPDELVFVRNATEAINLASYMLELKEDDEVICSLADHHSNFLPWSTKARVRLVMPDGDGRVSPTEFINQVTSKTKLIALGHVSNVTGIISPVSEIVRQARQRGILTLVDAAQSVPHMPVDVKALDCDFLAFSGHKMLGPSGIGVLYARQELLESAQPMLYGGGMVSRVTRDGFTLEAVPHKFEAGTPNIEGAIGMGAAARFLCSLGMENVREHGRQLARRLSDQMRRIGGLNTYPADSSDDRVPVASFAVPSMSANDLAALLCNRFNIMVRSGVHCAEPLTRHFGETGLVRISLCLYNTIEEVDYIGDALRRLRSFFA